MITIENLRRTKPKYAYDVKVDRSSILGNPYYMKNEGKRDYVCDLYEERFNKLIDNDKHWLEVTLITQEYRTKFIHELRNLYELYRIYKQLRLFCWCAPKRCHAETIKRYLEQVKYGEREEPICLLTSED